ncbi:hypothetical protein PROSTU_03203 [Providencia stuartii ATCC 25827]|uniref:Uncharacterized protein n=1 Tax=Providencia stuartii ATCC 25827 TaxID=471874 RepID=A0AA86YL87_PROST|nr:hypothetical protein PROSTU_03203 [Providencia stuartii ATCC 25827]
MEMFLSRFKQKHYQCHVNLSFFFLLLITLYATLLHHQRFINL